MSHQVVDYLCLGFLQGINPGVTHDFARLGDGAQQRNLCLVQIRPLHRLGAGLVIVFRVSHDWESRRVGLGLHTRRFFSFK